MTTERPDPEVSTCYGCGGQVRERPVTWSLQVGPRGEQWLCELCTRRNVRSIEGRLDEAWW